MIMEMELLNIGRDPGSTNSDLGLASSDDFHALTAMGNGTIFQTVPGIKLSPFETMNQDPQIWELFPWSGDVRFWIFEILNLHATSSLSALRHQNRLNGNRS